MNHETNKGSKGALWFFLAVTFTVTWLLCLVIYLTGGLGGKWGGLLSLCMLVPGLTALLTKALFRLDWADLALWKRGKLPLVWYLAGWVGPALLTCGGMVLYFLIWPGHFDPARAYVSFPFGLVAALALSILAAPLLNLLFCLGEELGWRGLLWTRLTANGSPRRAMLLSGLIWGLWHAPMIAMGHNYGTDYPGWPWWGILAMILFCLVTGCFFGYLRLRGGTVWPAALAHGSLNGCAGLGLLFLSPAAANRPFLGPTPTGIVGGCLFLAAGLLCFLAAGRRRAAETEAAETEAAETAASGMDSEK